ncbi:MAG TPA: N-acetylmuramoyl-L-alanine amidase [Opitutaceae bacterium]|nr:N-acetylmuramoyl-L-alanine amidase [Opitutaceae bacterium]
MARLRARGLAAILASLAWAGGCAGPASANGHPESVTSGPAPAPAPRAPAPIVAVPPPPPPPRLWPFRHIFGADYVDVAAIAERYGLKPAWVTSGRTLELREAGGRGRMKFEDRNRDFFFDGIRVFMGEPTVDYQGSLWVSKIDVIKTIEPLLRPEEHAGLLPPPPRLIVLDAGHGGNDPGNQNPRLHLAEKDMTLDVVLRLRKLLEAHGYRVQLTRSEDRHVDLDERDVVADRAKADLFLSVHFNALPPAIAQKVSGSETYTMTPQFQTSTEAEQDKSMIPTRYPGNRNDPANILLGYALHRELLHGLGTSDRGLKRRRLAVLRMLDCPGALVEAAFLSNDAEARRVSTPEFRQQIAEAIAAGVDAYAAELAALHPAETRPPVSSSK